MHRITSRRLLLRLIMLLTAAGIFFDAAAGADTITYTYDSNGQLTQVDYGGGNAIAYTYDAAGNITAVNATAAAGPQFYFPFYREGGIDFTGFAVSNYSDKPASLQFRAFG